jgi:hypothetical protein
MSGKYPGGFVQVGAPAGYSVAFDGSSYLQKASPASYLTDWTTTNFTIEYWINAASFGSGANGGSNVIGNVNDVGTSEYWTFGPVSGGTVKFYYFNGSGVSVSTSTVLSTNQWYHLAFVNNANALTIYINGVSSATATKSGTPQFGSSVAFTIGKCAGSSFTGYMSNIRISQNAVYTANFTPPTQLFVTPATQLLIGTSPNLIDQSVNNTVFTGFGAVKPSTFTPFTGYIAGASGFRPALGAAAPGVWTLEEATYYQGNRLWPIYDPNFNQTTLMLHGNQPPGVTDTSNNVFKDSSTNNFTITRNGNTTQGTFTPFSQTGWSSYNPGSGLPEVGIYLNGETDFAFGTGDFTIELWINLSSKSYLQVIYDSRPDATNGFYPTIYMDNTVNKLKYFTNNADRITATSTFTFNTWHHVVVTRTGTSTKMFVNGAQEGSTYTDSNNYINGASRPFTGDGFTPSGASAFTGVNGYTSNLRVVKGSGPYQSAGSTITVPTSPLTAVTNTVLLTLQSNRFIDTNTQASAKTINLFNGPSIQAFSPFAPTCCLHSTQRRW